MKRRVKTITTIEDLEELVDFYMSKEEIAFDVETRPHKGDYPTDFNEWTVAEQNAWVKRMALDYRRNEVFWISLASGGRADVIPLGHPNGDVLQLQHTVKYQVPDPKKEGQTVTRGPRKGLPYMITRTMTVPTTFTEPPKQLRISEVLKYLEPIFFSDKLKIGHNIQFDVLSLAKYFSDRIIPGPFADTLVMARLNNENRMKNSLDKLSEELIGATYPQVGASLATTTFDDAAEYALKDAKYTWLLWTILDYLLSEENLIEVNKLESQIIEVFLKMKHEGVHIDTDALEVLGKQLTERLDEIQGDLWRVNGQPFNINSPYDLSDFLFKKLKLEPTSLTPSGRPSTDKKALSILAKKNKTVNRLLDYRKVEKVRSTYVDGLRPTILKGSISANFQQTGTVTGRISCSSPNLQNIPRTGDFDDLDDFGGHIRNIFIPPPGYFMVGADYDQIELRAYAYYTQDPLMLRTFENDEDPHAATAANVLNKNIEDITKAERNIGKTLNFAIVYGAGPQTIAEQAGIGVRAAEKHLRSWQDTYKVAYAWNRQVVNEARRRKPYPYVATILGRRRRLPEVNHPVDKLRFRAERQAVNSVIQGSSADLIKLAMVRMDKMFKGTPFKIVLTVHDELISIAPEKDVEECAALMELAMCDIKINGNQPIFGSVPLTAEATWGESWAKAK